MCLIHINTSIWYLRVFVDCRYDFDIIIFNVQKYGILFDGL